jgi:hypothetical protein
LPAQDGNLVAQHDDLDGQVLLLTMRETDQLKNADEGNVEEGEVPRSIFVNGLVQTKVQVHDPDAFPAPTGSRHPQDLTQSCRFGV